MSAVFPYKDGWAGYVWVVTPEGKKTREETHDKWLKLHDLASKGPVPTKHPTVAAYLTRWLAEVIEPNREPTDLCGL
ncbi:hypothetical protein ACWDOR_23155 [Streptosporangium canum]|uniref:hypothetical protein n=1 Tax=Streptosporangium canum TaxID=324952 RepID=UPI0036D14446